MKTWARLEQWWASRRVNSRAFQRELDTFLALSLVKLRNQHGGAVLAMGAADADRVADEVVAKIQSGAKVNRLIVHHKRLTKRGRTLGALGVSATG